MNTAVSTFVDDDNFEPLTQPEIRKKDNSAISSLQWKCPDFSPILSYLVHGQLPDDNSQKKKILFLSEQYVVRIMFCSIFLIMGVQKEDMSHQYVSLLSLHLSEQMFLKLIMMVMLIQGLISHMQPYTQNTAGPECTLMYTIMLSLVQNVNGQSVAILTKNNH